MSKDEAETKESDKTLKQFTLTSVKNIQKAIENNKLVIFVGAGVSKNSDIPTWGELIKELAQDLGIKSKAHDNYGFDYYGNDDYLRIPQYYFNERKEREYLDKIRSILYKKDAQPNKIHDMIFDLNPAHIITTNYDDLLEKQFERKKINNIKYYKVASNEDLASAPVSNYIIKMHGEFENIVLKESDYDSYSENFKLIETFVKGLFATYTILFVGFSATDSNIRRIRQWIKDIIGDKQRPAYLIDVKDNKGISKEEFRIKHEYYKTQGIFILYKDQVKEEIDETFFKSSCKNEEKEKDILPEEGEDLYRFLYFIKNYKSFDVNKYYNKLKQLEELEVINNEVLVKVFNSNNIAKRLIADHEFSSESDQQRYEIDTFRLKIFLAYPEDSKDNIPLLQANSRLLQSKGIDSINEIINRKLSNEGDAERLFNIIKAYCSVTEDEIEKIKYINKIIEKAPKYEKESFIDNFIKHKPVENESCENSSNIGIFERALKLYNMRKYVQSYEKLDQISRDYSQVPVIYYIAEFNKKTVAETLKLEKAFSIYGMSEEEKRIAIESEKIDIERIINQKIPESIKPIIRMLSVENIEKQFLKFVGLNEKILNYKDFIKNGGIALSDNETERFLGEVRSFFNFMLGNYLFINKYGQLQVLWLQILRTILESYTTTYSESIDKNLVIFEQIIHRIEDFDYFILYLIIEFTTNDNLEKLLSRYRIKELKLKNRDKDIKILIISFGNYIDEIIQCDVISNDKTLNFLTIFRLIGLDNEADFKKIVSLYIKFVEAYLRYSKNNQNIYSGFLEFIRVVTNKFKDNKNICISYKIYEDIILQMYKLIREPSIYYYKDYFNLIIYCFEMLKKANDSKFDNQEIIDFYLDKAKEKQMECWDEILIEIYSLSTIIDQSNRNKIKAFIKGKYKTITEDNWAIFYLAVENGIIEFSEKFEKQLFDSIDDFMKKLDGSTLDESIEISCVPLVNLMNCLFCFIIKNKIEDKGRAKQLLDELKKPHYFTNNQQVLEALQRLIGIYLAPENSDGSKVQLDDFKYLNTNIIKKMKFNSDGLKNIMSQMIERIVFKENDSYLYDVFKDIFDIDSGTEGESDLGDENNPGLDNPSSDEDSSNTTSNTSGGTPSDSENDTHSDGGSNSSDASTSGSSGDSETEKK